MFDFSAITPVTKEAPINPREIFSALTNRQYERLRAEQVEVLEEWFKRRIHQSDFAIQMNTGSGKTIVGLLIAESGMRELGKPSTILVPDKYLVKQTLSEAKKLGVSATDQADDLSFRSCESILVTTIHKMFNGRNVFSTERHLLSDNFGTIIVDDAHAATAIVENQFSMVFPRQHPAYKNLLTLFENDLEEQNIGLYHELKMNGNVVTFLPVPINAIREKMKSLIALLSKAASTASDNGSAFFSYPLISEHPELLTITFSSEKVEITPLLPEISKIEAFCMAERRVFLSATYLDCDDLIKVFGVNLKPDESERKQTVLISPGSASDCGDRLIIPVSSIDSRIARTDIADLVADIQADLSTHDNKINVAVIVPNANRAELWKQRLGAHVVTADEMEDTVLGLSAENVREPLVFVNRYDGISLADSACRLLILDGAPRLHSSRKLRKAAALHNTPVHNKEIAKALEQGIGRGVRGAEDYCAILLLGDESYLATKKGRLSLFTPVLQKQIELGSRVCLQASSEGNSIANIKGALEQFLNRDKNWIKLSRDATSAAKYQDAVPSVLVPSRRGTTSNWHRYVEFSSRESLVPRRARTIPRTI